LDLARLSDAVSIFFKPFLCVKLHHFLVFLKQPHIQEEAANDHTSPSLTVVAVKDGYSLNVLTQKLCYFVTDSKEKLKRRGFVILPVVAYNVFEDLLINRPSADVDGDVFSVMLCL
jgi:hypothetical protein